MSLAQAHELDHIVKVAQIYVASTSAILVWEWLSCLPKEWQYIWRTSWSPIKALYLIVRYYTLLVLVVTDVWFFASWSQPSCSKYVRVLPGVAVLIDLSIEAVLCLRVYALFGSSRKVGIFLALLMAGFLGVMTAVPILAFTNVNLPQWPGPCLVTGKPSIAGPKFIIAFYASPMCVDLIVTAMTLYKSYTSPVRPSASGTLAIFLRDGLFYFAAITSLNLINVIFFIQRNTDIQSINAPMSIQLSSVLCCRLILNLRASRDAKPAVKRFSRTINRWIDDFQVDTMTDEVQPVPPLDNLSHHHRMSSGAGRQNLHAMKDLESGPEPRRTQELVIQFQREIMTDDDEWDKNSVQPSPTLVGSLRR